MFTEKFGFDTILRARSLTHQTLLSLTPHIVYLNSYFLLQLARPGSVCITGRPAPTRPEGNTVPVLQEAWPVSFLSEERHRYLWPAYLVMAQRCSASTPLGHTLQGSGWGGSPGVLPPPLPHPSGVLPPCSPTRRARSLHPSSGHLAPCRPGPCRQPPRRPLLAPAP